MVQHSLRFNLGEKMKRTIAIWAVLLLALGGLSVWAQTSAPPSAPAVPVTQASPSYVIGPEDALFISVWKESDLTETLPVRADGMIS